MKESSRQEHASTPLTKRRKFLYIVITFTSSVFLALVLAEVVLQVVFIPGIRYHTYYYDDQTGGRHYPNATFLYRFPGQEEVRRHINSWGYLDKDHEVAKAPGITRIGFFGDSYTQASQVPLEETYFRLIEDTLNSGGLSPTTECLAFGVSGFSMLQSYLNCARWADSLALDWVVYAFVENDLGDQIRVIKRSNLFPYPYPEGDSFGVDFSFRDRYGHKASRFYRFAQYIRTKSLVVSTIVERTKLLKRRGVKLRLSEEDMQMAGKAEKGGILRSIYAPSSWPDTLVSQAKDLGERIMRKWAEDMRASEHRFAVLYIPRHQYISTPFSEQDSWATWLVETCRENNVPIIDPSPYLAAEFNRGNKVFVDHLAAGGHTALAAAFVDFYRSQKK